MVDSLDFLLRILFWISLAWVQTNESSLNGCAQIFPAFDWLLDFFK